MFTKKNNQTEDTKITAKTREYLNVGAQTNKESAQTKASASSQSAMGLQMGGEQSLVSKTALGAILIAAAISVVLSFLPHPYGMIITYPMNVFVTFIHEGCHALMVILTGGTVSGIGVNPDTSGVTPFRGGIPLLAIPAGYIGSTVFGALLIRLMQKGVPSKALLMATGIILGLLTLATIPAVIPFLVAPVPNLFGLIFGVFLTALFIFAALKLPKKGANIALAVTAVQCILGSLLKLHLVFQTTLRIGEHQDPQIMQSLTLVPAIIWAFLWAITSLAALWYVLRPAAWKNAKKS
jgi:hypothetical protein